MSRAERLSPPPGVFSDNATNRVSPWLELKNHLNRQSSGFDRLARSHILCELPIHLFCKKMIRFPQPFALEGIPSKMKLHVPRALGLLLVSYLISSSFAQEPGQSNPAQPIVRVQTSLVLVDVISQDHNSGLPVRDFKKENFRVFDNKHEVPISSFDAGASNDTRPVNLWLVVLCNERGKIGGSAGFVGNEALFRPAFDHLDNKVSVGVAHWCDNGETQLDLPPTEDRDSPISVLAKTIRPITFQAGEDSYRVGETAFRRLIRLIIQDAHRRNPQPLPVIVFLDGDNTGQPHASLDQVVDDFLGTSGIVFGIKDSRAPIVPMLTGGDVAEIEHYMADHTGGQFFSAAPGGYTGALQMILLQLHFRYELGFIPPAIDGKHHNLRVELTKGAKENHKGVRLRYRPEYIPVLGEPAWAR